MPFISSRAIVQWDGADGLRAAASTWLNALTEPLSMILVTGDSEVPGGAEGSLSEEVSGSGGH